MFFLTRCLCRPSFLGSARSRRSRAATRTGTKTCHRHVFLAALMAFQASGLRNAKKETPSKRMVFLFLERATEKPPKRCLWQNKRGGFKEVSQWPVPERGRALADTTRAQLRRMQSFSFDAPSAKFTATWLGSLTAHSAVTRTRAPKRATGTFFSLCSCPVRASADAIPKKKHHPAG